MFGMLIRITRVVKLARQVSEEFIARIPYFIAYRR